MLITNRVPSPSGGFIQIIDGDSQYEACRIYPLAHESDEQTLARARALAKTIERGWEAGLDRGLKLPALWGIGQ